MPTVASDVMDLAAEAFLNDPSRAIYTNTVLLPHLQAAGLMLQSKLLEAGVSTLDISTITSSHITLAVGETQIGEAGDADLPADFIVPINLGERLDGSTEQFSPIRQVEQLPEREASAVMGVYVWQNEQLQFLGATTAREIKLEYQKGITEFTGANDTVYQIGSKLYLAAETAAQAALVIGRNKERADALEYIAQRELSSYVRTRTKEAQGYPAQRLPYGYNRRLLRRANTQGR
jgi:hypothetical protein